MKIFFAFVTFCCVIGTIVFGMFSGFRFLENRPNQALGFLVFAGVSYFVSWLAANTSAISK